MGAAARRHLLDPASDPQFLMECLQARANARAWLWFCWQITDLHDATDPLWLWADRWGLVDHFGIDTVQAVLAAAFDPYRGDLYPVTA